VYLAEHKEIIKYY